MNYQETISFLYSRLPMFSRIGAGAYKKDLGNIRSLSEKLGNPHEKFRTIHVAGTNGKGSVSHMLSAVLQTAGYKTGLYTSPHLRDYRERIRVNGAMIPESFVVEFTELSMDWYDEIDPSFFEVSVAMAFEYFSRENVDIAVIEVGLGGRLDSTNIIIPELSVITNIGWDHMNILGDTLEKISAEKAGIIKPGIPVVIGETQAESAPVFIRKAQMEKSPIYFADQTRFANEWELREDRLHIQVADHHHADQQHYILDLSGTYQVKNCITVLEALHQLSIKGWNVGTAQIKEGLSQVRPLTGLHGRWEIIRHHPSVVLDVGHNKDGIRQILNQLDTSNHDHLHIVFGMVKDKDVAGVLELLPKDATYYFTRSEIPRALDEEQLHEQAALQGLKGKAYPDVNTALKSAIEVSGPEDMVLVCGSVFLVGEVKTEAVMAG